MTEDGRRESRLSRDVRFKTKVTTPLLARSFANLFAKGNKQSIKSDPVFQGLLYKFQSITNDKNDRLSCIRRTISLLNELIQLIDKATFNDNDDFQTLMSLLASNLSMFQSIAQMGNEKLFTYEVFFDLLNLLTKPQIHSFLENRQSNLTFSQKSCMYLVNLLLNSIANATVSIPLMKDDIAAQKYADTFSLMCNRVNYDLQSGTSNNKTTDCILSMFWNLTDRTIIIDWFLGIDFVKTMLECLKIIDLSSTTANQIIGIIYNISRHDQGADELIQFNGRCLLRDIQNRGTSLLSEDNDLTISMAMALLSTSEQIHSDSKRMNRILNQLLQIVIKAGQNVDHRENGFHISEPLAVFTKLFDEDHSLEYIFNQAQTDPQLGLPAIIDLFTDLFIKFQQTSTHENQQRQFTRIALLNILWRISFQDRYKTKLREKTRFLQIVKNLTRNNQEILLDQYIPHSMKSITIAANGIVYNLNQAFDRLESVTVEKPLVSNVENEKPIVMISYAHENNYFCDKILAVFDKNRDLFKVWIDRDHCSSNEDLWEKIARGIRQSSIVICLLSQDYYNSKSCRKEATFAVRRRKAIIPVYIGDPGDCDWLDIHIAGLKYIRYKNNSNVLEQDRVQDLLKTIQATIREVQSQSIQGVDDLSTPIPEESQTKRPFHYETKRAPNEWTVDDIHRWFDEQKVPESVLKLFDFQSFTEMDEYAKKLRVDSSREFTKCERRYAQHHGDELEEYIFNRFKKALLSLVNKHSPATKEVEFF